MTRNINEISFVEILKSRFDGDFKIIKYCGKDKNRRYLYEIEFINTGYKVITSSQNIRRGEVKDYFKPIVCSVGYLGSNEKFTTYKFHKKLYMTWRNMLGRCYNPEEINYSSYGAKGYYVNPEWFNYTKFFKDAQELPGWNESNIDRLTIDKDGLVLGNKCYSKEYCQWVTLEQNNEYKELLKKEIIGISPDNQGRY